MWRHDGLGVKCHCSPLLAPASPHLAATFPVLAYASQSAYVNTCLQEQKLHFESSYLLPFTIHLFWTSVTSLDVPSPSLSYFVLFLAPDSSFFLLASVNSRLVPAHSAITARQRPIPSSMSTFSDGIWRDGAPFSRLLVHWNVIQP